MKWAAAGVTLICRCWLEDPSALQVYHVLGRPLQIQVQGEDCLQPAKAAAGAGQRVGRLQSGLVRVNAAQESGTKWIFAWDNCRAPEPAGSLQPGPGEDGCSLAGHAEAFLQHQPGG